MWVYQYICIHTNDVCHDRLFADLSGLSSAFQNAYCQLQCDLGYESLNHTVCVREQQRCGAGSKCGLQFAVIDLDDDDRQYILDIHNYFRNKVALGFEKRGRQPSASNMNIMKYNKELEFISQCWANTCNGNPLIHDRCRRTSDFEHVGQNLGFISSSNPKINKIRAMKELIILWYDEVAIFNNSWISDTRDRGSEYKVGHYTQLIWADSTDVGCAMTYYSEEIFNVTWYQVVFVCNYGPGGNFVGLPIYKIGQPASECSNGEKRNRLYRGLCGISKYAKNAANFTFDIYG
ncbi:venom allergen 5 2-like [Cylas formicarius]|uniref:venom allergen 5 2-like n=1 Tax=Cylas formicarius TaxID=197179 RepID=UPI00295896BC|nr:venom allergen 5 2-like [Cylas formicarius]